MRAHPRRRRPAPSGRRAGLIDPRDAVQTLEAIHAGGVDALVVATPGGDRIYTLQGADFAYRMVVEQMGEGAAALGLDGAILYCNRRFAELLRLPLEQAIGANVHDFLSPPRALHPLLAQAAWEPTRMEMTWRRMDGSVIDLQLSLNTLTAYEVPAVIVIATDLTGERKRQELTASEKLARAILEQAAEAIVVCDAAGRVIRASRAARKLCGDARGETFEALFPLKTAQGGEPLSLARRGCDGETLTSVQAAFECAGKPLALSASVAPLRDEGGAIIGCIVTLTDITEQKRLEAKVHGFNAELERRIADRTAQLTAANAELESFNYSVSHDLRSPLRSISGFSQSLRRDYGPALDETARDYCERIHNAAQRMSGIIDAMLALSRTTLSELRRTEVDLSGLAQAIEKDLRAAEPGRRVAFEAAPGLKAMGDQAMLRVALENLLSNAWKFTAANPAARVEFGFDPGAGAFYVRDNGIGFDMMYVDKIFRPFQRLDPKGEFAGTGIGLALAQRVFLRHHGRVWARSRPGEGAAFFFTIGPSASAPEGREEDVLLLVEDDPDDVALTLRAFEAQGLNRRVLVARDGVEAYGQLFGAGDKRLKPALTVLDLNLPKMSGLELLARIRADAVLKDLRVAVLTSSDEPRDHREAERLGVEAYLLKPVGLDAFTGVVETLKSLLLRP
jgi:PAS domain S-box-containing protein